MSRRLLLVALLTACPPPADDPIVGAAPERLPFPWTGQATEQGLTLPELPSGSTPVPAERVAWRTGFSPVQTVVVPLDEALDPDSLGTLDAAPVGGSVQLWSLSDGTEIPAYAELDACPWAEGPAPLLVRPLAPMPPGEVLVVLTDGLRTAPGTPWSAPAWYADAVSGTPHPDLADAAEALTDALTAAEGLGVDGAVMAWSFRVDRGDRRLGALAPDVSSGAHELTEIDGDDLPGGVWKQAEGTLTVSSWLGDDGRFVLGDDGLPIPQGTREIPLFVHVPESARGADAGSVPVWIFGHGIFSEPSRYLADDTDPSGVIDVADRAGAILVATVWPGLTTRDVAIPAQVGGDFGRIPELTNRLGQGVLDQLGLFHALTAGTLLDDPVFAGLADPEEVAWYGISLGAIEGAVTVAIEPELQPAVLHVGGAAWSTMLERSQHWTLFEDLIIGSGVDDPVDRQLLYATSQLFWDLVDGASWVDELAEADALWQIAIGDDQVPNLASWTLARGVGATMLAPVAESPWGVPTASGPLPGPAFAVFDPEEGSSDESKLPARDTTSHETPRLWDGCKEQTVHFLAPATAGEAVHACGTSPCDPDNPG